MLGTSYGGQAERNESVESDAFVIPRSGGYQPGVPAGATAHVLHGATKSWSLVKFAETELDGQFIDVRRMQRIPGRCLTRLNG